MTDPTNEPHEKKIFIDEDWKAKVEAEKDEFQKKGSEAESKAADPSGRPSAASAEIDPPLPKPSLEFLATTMALQAAACLGRMPDPVSGKTEPRPNRARHFIDTIELLYEKTAGNRSPGETAALEQLLHNLRLDYIDAMDRAASGRP